ncbi:uncharacterized protein LOC122663310 [Telopea speciosissima]|uniref:uncharacterized protein LOC122663310 n=1 Tax=Telopea speciosissima TaxID=54955 RepID=UPI001CC76E3D|nr:uncharacterized protein LOC122663310 [Telopea speciosissima]
MEKQTLDFFLVPLGLCLLLVYHIWLLHQIINHPMTTVIGVNIINKRIWVRTMMEDAKNGTLAVQTLRNNIMASTVLASTAIMQSSVVTMMMSNPKARTSEFVFGDQSELGFWIKFLSIFVCFLLAFFFNVQSIRYYSHASMLINVPVKKMKSSPELRAEYVGKVVNRGSCFWSLGLRAFYLSLPLYLWLFGPIPMFLCCVVLVFMLHFLDLTFDFGEGGVGIVDDKDEEAGW